MQLLLSACLGGASKRLAVSRLLLDGHSSSTEDSKTGYCAPHCFYGE